MAPVQPAWQSHLSGHLLCLSPHVWSHCGTHRPGGAPLSPQDAKPPPQNSALEDRPFIREGKGRQQSEEEAEREEKGKKMTSRVIEEDDVGSRWMAERGAERRTKLRSSLASYARAASGQWALLSRAGSCQAPRLGRGVLSLSPGSLQ